MRAMRCRDLLVPTLVLCAGLASPALAYRPIAPDPAAKTVVLTGHDLSIPQLLAVARGGAKVAYAPEARARAKDAYGLMLEAAAEGVPVYAFNRGGGTGRNTVTFTGDPTSPENKTKLAAGQLRAFQNGARAGAGPELDDEEAVRAMMVVRANTIVDDAPSPQLLQMLLDLLNDRITPVVQSHGTVGDGDLALMSNIGGTMAGRGEAYLNGVRMPAAEALAKAGLKSIEPSGSDNSTLTSTNAYTASQAALLAADAQETLQWADLIYGMDLLAMNSSITPLSRPTQLGRPDKTLNWHASRMLDMLKGSYLFEVDPKRTFSDPDSLRASSIRQASAWLSWSDLRQQVLFQINSSDHNPAIRVGVAPADSWELSTPMLMQFYVKGGALSGGRSGYIVTNANWDPFPLAGRVDAFTAALANMDAAVLQRIYRFAQPFHTGVTAAEVLTPDQRAQAAPQGNGTTIVAYWGEALDAASFTAPAVVASDNEANGDLESLLPLRVAKARTAVRATRHLLAHDLMTATYWMDVRKAQNPGRNFGAVPTAVWMAWRRLTPWQLPAAERPDRPPQDIAYDFLIRTTPVSLDPALASLPVIDARP
jgi:histidine ammonia-lyase